MSTRPQSRHTDTHDTRLSLPKKSVGARRPGEPTTLRCEPLDVLIAKG